ncbi:hypothetical protein B0H13DRAFT_2569433, partial [Mycena leptocephala]
SQNTRLSHLLRSNDVPLEADIPSIRNIISEGQSRERALTAQMAALEAEILRLEGAIKRLKRQRSESITQLKQRRTETMNYIRQHHAVISPVRRVPPELIAEIFALTLASPRAWDAKDMMKQPPWRLSQICRSWRYTALSFPPLWSSI